MSHASLRMIVHVATASGGRRPVRDSDEQRKRFVLPRSPATAGRVHAHRADGGHRRGPARRVVREGDTYLLSGEKHLITFGVSCDHWLLFARLEGTTRQATARSR